LLEATSFQRLPCRVQLAANHLARSSDTIGFLQEKSLHSTARGPTQRHSKFVLGSCFAWYSFTISQKFSPGHSHSRYTESVLKTFRLPNLKESASAFFNVSLSSFNFLFVGRSAAWPPLPPHFNLIIVAIKMFSTGCCRAIIISSISIKRVLRW
jgi:hypothetical protein